MVDLLQLALDKKKNQESKKASTKTPDKIQDTSKIIPDKIVCLDENVSENSISSIENILNSIDISRGLYRVATLSGDRKSTKEQMNLKIKKILLTPEGFGNFLENLSKYLKSI